MARTYELVTVSRAGGEHVREYVTDDELTPGSVLLVNGRYWLADRVEGNRVHEKPARYRLRLRHPDGRQELGAFRRFRPDAPRLGHAFSTAEDGRPISWQVVDEQLARDEQGEPYLDLVAERDFGEAEEGVPDHELEHMLAARGDDERREAAVAALDRAERQGLYVELVALDEGEAPDWKEAEELIDALVLEMVNDDLLERCGVDPRRDRRETWLDTVKARLREDLARFRGDIEGDHDEIEEWDFGGARIFAVVGTYSDEANPNSGYGWMCRLLDAEALGAAGFERVRKPQL